MKRLCITLFAAAFAFAACSAPEVADIPLPEHPRPDFERAEWVNLNGSWNFSFEEPSLDGKILVPFPWGSPLSGVEDGGDIAWYGRSITIPKSWKGKRVFLVVGASDWETSAWMDEKELGVHRGGYTPFEFELEGVKPGSKHEIKLRVDDTYSASHLYGKQGYGNARGIWQTVYLEARGSNYISSLHFTPDIDGETVKVDVKLSEEAAEGENFTLEFKTGDQECFSAPISGKEASYTIKLQNQHLWDLDDPFLYEVRASLEKGGDVVESYFGQRKIGTAFLPGTNFNYVALNGKPIYLQLTLDQSYNPEGYYTFPSDEFMKNEIEISKKLGLTGNRIHIKVEVPRKLYWADRLGLLIMADTPNFWGEPVPEAREDWEHCLLGQIERDYNHPSIFAWVNFNETWGLHTKGEYLPETQEWVRSMHRLTKTLDPSRLAEDNSACLRDHVETDINSWHSYRPGWDWNREIEEYVRNTYVGSGFNYIAPNVQTDAPMINSECGNVWGYEGSAGDCDFTWDYHIMMDAFRRNPNCAGWLYTEHHDVINEWNGYVHYDRSPKYDGLGDIVPDMTLADFHSPYYVSPRHDLFSVKHAGAKFNIPLFVSFMTDRNPGTHLTIDMELVGWDAAGDFHEYGGRPSKVSFEPYLNRYKGMAQVTLPEENGLYILRYVLKNDNWEVLHRNFSIFRVKDGKDPEGVRLVSFSTKNPSSSQWSRGQSEVLGDGGLKVNGFGNGYFEYKVKIPADVDLSKVKSASLVFEASSRKIFGKDVEGGDVDGDRMLGGGSKDPCKSLNSFAMTDDDLWPSVVTVSVNGYNIGTVNLEDCPADHRGILSWSAQPKKPWMREAGSYGQLVKLDIPVEDPGTDEITVRFTVPEGSEGGLSLFGKDFGRYPLDPTFVLKY